MTMNLEITLGNQSINNSDVVVVGRNGTIGGQNESNNRLYESFSISGTLPAPVIGYHQKDLSSLERFDPLLMQTTNQPIVNKNNEQSDNEGPYQHPASMINNNTNEDLLSKATSMIMNTNFFESEYPEPVSPTNNKSQRRLRSPTIQRRHRKSASMGSSIRFDKDTTTEIYATDGKKSNVDISPGLPRHRKTPAMIPFMNKKSDHEGNSTVGTVSQSRLRINNGWKGFQRNKMYEHLKEERDDQVSSGYSRSTENNTTNDIRHEYGDIINEKSILTSDWLSSNTISPGTSTTEYIKSRPTSLLTDGHFYIQRSSEQHPTEWQVEIPNKDEFIMSINVCKFLDSYNRTVVDDDNEKMSFDLAKFVGYSCMELHQIVNDLHGIASHLDKRNVSSWDRSIITDLLQCGKEITSVKGYVAIDTGKINTNNNDSKLDVKSAIRRHCHEALILEGDRKFICCIRTTSIKRKHQYTKSHPWETNDIHFNSSGQNDVNVNNTKVKVFKDSTMELAELQTTIFPLLDKITDDNPFYDVIFCGHSFGSSLATLAGFKYASTRLSLLVAVYCTGTTLCEVGLLDFRFACHTLPNLKIIRMDISRSTCPFYNPDSTCGPCHVGHLLQINTTTTTTKTTMTEGILKTNEGLVQAYKFGIQCPLHTKDIQKASPIAAGKLVSSSTSSSSGVGQGLFRTKVQVHLPRNRGSSGNNNNASNDSATINEYVNAVQQLGINDWVTTFSNENFGSGVIGSNDECRQLS